MISRVADQCFWLGRYLERFESTARVLPATRHLALDGELTPRQCWLPVIIVAGEEKRFLEKHGEMAAEDGDRVQHYMTWDEKNYASIRNSVTAVRENARGMREVLSSEAWQAINEIHLWLGSPRAQESFQRDPDGFYRRLRDTSMLVLGTIRSTMLHDEPLDFISLGVLIERVSQTARILDVHYHTVTHRPSYFDGPLSADSQSARHAVITTAISLALLRACSGIEPFMQRHQGRVSSKQVAKFLVQEPRHPRSIHYCVHAAHVRFKQLRPENRHDLPGGRSLERLRALDEWLGQQDDDVLENGEMHEMLTHVVDEVAAICNEIGQELLGHPPPDEPSASIPPEAPPPQSQSQSQSQKS